MVKTLDLNRRESDLLTELVVAYQKAQRDLHVGLAFVLGAREITEGSFVSLDSTDRVLTVEVPDGAP